MIRNATTKVATMLAVGLVAISLAAAAQGAETASSLPRQIAQAGGAQAQGGAAVFGPQEMLREGISIQELENITSTQAAGPTPDFTFHVPLDLENIHPDAQRARVVCWAWSGNGWDNDDLMGAGSADVPVAGGGYSGTVTVAFDRREGHEAAVPTNWICIVGLVNSNDVFAAMSQSEEILPWHRAAEGSTFFGDEVGASGPFSQ